MSEQYLIGLFIFLSMTTKILADNDIVSGPSVSCKNEGDEIPVPPSKASNPCTICYCRNGEISCYNRKCPALAGCHQVIYPKPVGECCSSCKGCTYKGVSYKSGEQWPDPHDSCQKYKCIAGVVTGLTEKCFVSCKNPVHTPGQCCPVCNGCEDHGNTYKDGDTFHASLDECVNCKCKNGTSVCSKVGCPVLNCPRQYWKKDAGSCCPYCTGSRTVYNIRGFCLFQTRVHRSGLSFRPDRCTACECKKSGTLICQLTTCPILDCPEDEILHTSGDCCRRCRPKKSCSASSGKSYEHKNTWVKSNCVTCKCDDGAISCTKQQCSNQLNCPQNYNLVQLPGDCCPRCVEGEATCTVFGDPHYKTFDGNVFHFQGKCKYILTRTCYNEFFKVVVSNRVRTSNSYTWTKSASIVMNGSHILLNQMLRVRVDRKRINLPFVRKGLFDIRRDGQAVVVTTTIGIKVIWDGDSYLEVNVPSTFKNKMCGLCGNYNGIEADDKTGSDNQLYYNIDEFGESWKTGNEKHCHVAKNHIGTAPCHGPSMKRLLAHHECAAIHGDAFAPCREKIDVRPYYKACVMDVCDCPNNQQCSCEALVAYSRACEKELDFYLNWRSANLCGAPKCQIDAVYDTCMSACPETCNNNGYNRRKCKRPCVSGCRCLPGFVLHKDRCIQITECSKNDHKTKENDRKRKKRKSRKFKPRSHYSSTLQKDAGFSILTNSISDPG